MDVLKSLEPDIGIVVRSELLGYALSLIVSACVIIPLYVYFLSAASSSWSELSKLLNLVVSISSIPMYANTIGMVQTINRLVFDRKVEIAKGLPSHERNNSVLATRTRNGIGIHWIFISDFLQSLYVVILMFDSIPASLTVFAYQWCLKLVRIILLHYGF